MHVSRFPELFWFLPVGSWITGGFLVAGLASLPRLGCFGATIETAVEVERARGFGEYFWFFAEVFLIRFFSFVFCKPGFVEVSFSVGSECFVLLWIATAVSGRRGADLGSGRSAEIGTGSSGGLWNICQHLVFGREARCWAAMYEISVLGLLAQRLFR